MKVSLGVKFKRFSLWDVRVRVSPWHPPYWPPRPRWDTLVLFKIFVGCGQLLCEREEPARRRGRRSAPFLWFEASRLLGCGLSPRWISVVRQGDSLTYGWGQAMEDMVTWLIIVYWAYDLIPKSFEWMGYYIRVSQLLFSQPQFFSAELRKIGLKFATLNQDSGKRYFVTIVVDISK